ncbi:uncharacterized protein LOC111302770 [Durio zibethinus]|uniref:Uncharacterized protein LOC111302770 n=1 Tax=Durio zibethinus TaxID=66656 RepID=A0A6P5ZP60_DURZI|nr:uncharacterized protein LOC111302770 [Durio zibethinus]
MRYSVLVPQLLFISNVFSLSSNSKSHLPITANFFLPNPTLFFFKIMTLETSKPDQSTNEGDKHRQLDKDIKDLVSAITRRIPGIHKPGSSHHEDDDDEHGVRIITLAGNNAGATMRSELDEKSSPHGISLGEPDAVSTYVNSNFQSVNNSIMLNSSYNTNDPGVHLDVSDAFDQEGQMPADKPRRRGKKREKDSSESEHSD